MKEKEDFPAEHMEADEFVDLAKAILKDKDTYEDDLIKITAGKNHLDLEVTRKRILNGPSHLYVENPTTMVAGRQIIRHHGEHCYIVPHMKALAAQDKKAK